MANSNNRHDLELELQETENINNNNTNNNNDTSENVSGTALNDQSALKHNFYRMSEYFNILDRVFHYKRINNNTRPTNSFIQDSYSSSSSSTTNVGNSENENTQTIETINNNNNNNNNNYSNFGEVLGQGNDGVFSNLSAKPESSFDRRERLMEVFHQQLQLNNSSSNNNMSNNVIASSNGNVYDGNMDLTSLTGPGVYNINQLYEQLANGGSSLTQQTGTSPSSSTTTNNNTNGRNANGIDDGEFERGDKPPSYEDAHNDNAPSYWDLSPEGSLYYDEICVAGLPAGSIINFVWNCIVSTSFQFFGFLITYILHTSHAAKEGSRCGLGITFLSLGFKLMPNNVSNKVGKGKEIPRLQSLNPFNHDLSVFYKGSNPDSLEAVVDFEDEELLKEKLETHSVLKNLDDFIATTTLQPDLSTTMTSSQSSTTSTSSLINSYHNNNEEEDSFDKAQLVKPDTFESHLSQGSDEKYDHNTNVTFMKILSIFLFILGSLIIIQSFYQYYKIKMMERKLIRQQEGIDDLRDNYYSSRRAEVNETGNVNDAGDSNNDNNNINGGQIQPV
ncbi:hypothetical protein HANVADRAFT_51903 [Hanseniaspora valbyensis NRRL Y-1626]|uniref:Uncharacterized protein n=1 Tax=Hanseniaspora valbyensis NRRL Y-1626 TaxID=766949 RepID=A0A1B7TGB3_9ASCO|nr:hypothetical protein HANVADRAFT_51903 [Hanseniaspora valbyensis NRRL Y-1626]